MIPRASAPGPRELLLEGLQQVSQALHRDAGCVRVIPVLKRVDRLEPSVQLCGPLPKRFP